jgi:hypothetical protein
MAARNKEIAVATVAIAAAVISVYYALAGRSEKIDLDTYSVLGAVSAEESAKLAGNKGQVLIMIPDSGPSKNPSVEAEIKAFEKTINKQKGMTSAVEKVEVSAMTMMATGGGVPVEQFFKALEKHKGAAVLALFFGFPDLTGGDLDRFKQYRLKTLVVSSFRSTYKSLCDQGAIQIVISPRQDTPAANPQSPKTVRERFDQDFSITPPEESHR